MGYQMVPQKVKLVTPVGLGPNILETAGDVILQ